MIRKNQNATRHNTGWPAALLLAACLLGCSGSEVERVPVSGKVLLDGEPVSRGTIRVEPKGVRMAASKIDDQGRFELMTYERGDGAPLGKHPVSVTISEPVGGNAIRWLAPPKYAESSTSGLMMEISGPRDDVVVELTWDGKKPFVQNF